MDSSWITMGGNALAMVASLVCVVFILLIWHLTRARWTMFMAIAFACFFVIRVGIIAETPILEPYSRAITSLIYVLLAVGFIDMWLGMRHFYIPGSLNGVWATSEDAARMVKLASEAAIRAADAATEATAAASKAADAASMALVIANESRRAAGAADSVTKESRE